jgi:ATP-binding cassette subfamily B (MDR/TAP) protein 1
MAGDLTEKAVPEPSTRTSSQGDSSFEQSSQKEKVEQSANETPSDDVANLQRLDSKVVNVVEEEDDPFKHLPPHEAEILKTQVHVPVVKVGYFMLYRYATFWDKVIIAISAICAIAGGAVLPLMTVIFGQLTAKFKDFFYGGLSTSDFSHTLSHFVLYFVYLAIGEFVTIYIATAGFIYTGEHISAKIRAQYLAACIRQNIGFFDKLGSGEVTTRITADTNLIQDGISEKVGLTLTALATFVTAFVIGFVKYWKLTLILTSTVFAITFIMGGGSSFIVKYNKKSLESYALGGTVAEEVISSIRNATAFGTQNKLARQYDKHLTEAEKWGFKNRRVLGTMIGGMMCVGMYKSFPDSSQVADGSDSLSQLRTCFLAR